MSAATPHTPGIFGYVVGVVVSAWALTPVAGFSMLVDESWVTSVFVWPVLLLYGFIGAPVVLVYGAPVALAGVVVVHLICSRVESQRVHVAVAVAAGLVGTLVYGQVLDIRTFGPLAWSAVAVGISAGIGRAAVIPLVRSRRRLAAAGRLTGTARW